MVPEYKGILFVGYFDAFDKIFDSERVYILEEDSIEMPGRRFPGELGTPDKQHVSLPCLRDGDFVGTAVIGRDIIFMGLVLDMIGYRHYIEPFSPGFVDSYRRPH